jgi:hypothetical protein
MSRLLSERDFDLAGVQAEDGGPVVGFVTRLSLDAGGTVGDHMTALAAEHLICDTTPLPTVLSVLLAKKYLFVLVGPDVKGIVTRTDLNKPPLRIYLFGIISLLEMHLTFWVKTEYTDDTWQTTISPVRVKGAQKVQQDREVEGQKVDLIECLQLCDKRDLLLKREAVCADLGLVPKSQARKRLVKAETLRNRLAHAQQDLVQGSSWEELIDLVDWVEKIVHKSDDSVEQHAATSARKISGAPSCEA